MKNIILQHFTGELRELDKLSIENIKKYASFVGADYKFIEGQVFRKHLASPCQKVYMLDEVFDEYDTVLMLDIDMFTTAGMFENVFECEGIGLYNDTQKRLHRQISNAEHKLGSINHPYWGGAIYKMDKNLRQILRKGLGDDESWMENFNSHYQLADEGIMHTLVVKADFKTENPYLDNKWCQCSFLPNPETAGFIHIRIKVTPTGPKKEKIENYRLLVDQGIIKE